MSSSLSPWWSTGATCHRVLMLSLLCCMLLKRGVSATPTPTTTDCVNNNINNNHHRNASSTPSLWKWLPNQRNNNHSTSMRQKGTIIAPPPVSPLPRWFQFQTERRGESSNSLPRLGFAVSLDDNEDDDDAVPRHQLLPDISQEEILMKLDDGVEWGRSFEKEKGKQQYTALAAASSETASRVDQEATSDQTVGKSSSSRARTRINGRGNDSSSPVSSLPSTTTKPATNVSSSTISDQELSNQTKSATQQAVVVNETTATQTNWDTGKERFFSEWEGCLDIDLQGVTIRRGSESATRTAGRSRPSNNNSCQLQVDPKSLLRLLKLSGPVLFSFGSALLGTLRWLAPLIVARRALNWIGENIILDWYRGYYLRTTYRRMEEQYFRYYQGPAILRSLGRLASQIVLLMTLGRIMEWMVGLSHAPCLIEVPILLHNHGIVLGSGGEGGGCHWWCGFLWLFAVVGTGHAGAAAIAVWGGPLRIQAFAPFDRRPLSPPSARNIFTRPWRLILWMRDPDKWIRSIANTTPRFYTPEPLRPFQPDPLLFPATWEPLRLLMMIGVAREMTCNRRMMHALMRSVLVQQSFADEWYRALMVEKRVALGILLMAGFLMASLFLFWTITKANNGISISFLLPYLFSVIISGYMNIFFYNDIRKTKKQAAASRAPAEFWLQGKFVVQSVQW